MAPENTTSAASGDEDLSDEEMRKLLKPSVTKDHILQLVKEHYATTSSSDVQVLNELDSYDDQNFVVTIDATKFLFKVHNGVESNDYRNVLSKQQQQADDSSNAEQQSNYYQPGGMTSVIHFQTAMIDCLSRHAIATTTSIPPNTAASSGGGAAPLIVAELPVVSTQHSPSPLVCRLLGWVDGRPMSAVKLLPLETLADAGRFLGRMHEALDDMIPVGKTTETDTFTTTADESLLVPARRYHQWDGKHTADLRTYTKYIANEKRRGLVESVLDAFQQQILDTNVGDNFRKGINHGDFNDANIILNNDWQVKGVIDFGDSIESWRVLDVSVAMAYSMLSSYAKSNQSSIAAAAAFLRGYNAVHPLDATERQHLVLLLACRLSCSVTLGAYSYQQNPENKYLLLHAEPAWQALELIWDYNTDRRAAVTAAANRLFDQACLHNGLVAENHDSNKTSSTVNCSDLGLPDPSVVDLLQSIRVSSTNDGDKAGPPLKKQKLEQPAAADDDKSYPVLSFVTGNAKKLEEVKRILGVHTADSSAVSDDDGSATSLPFSLTNVKLDLPELQGDPNEICQEKCAAAAKEVGGAVIVEDTSLCFNALNGMPGVYIKYFLNSCGHDGLNKMLTGFDNKTAYAQTVVGFCPGPGKEILTFDGRTAGKIVMPRGKLDFGWDPVFEPDEGNGKTYAEMSKEEKDAISHRSRAFAKLRDFLDKSRDDIRAQIMS